MRIILRPQLVTDWGEVTACPIAIGMRFTSASQAWFECRRCNRPRENA